MKIRHDRLILAMEDSELEEFCRRWVERRLGYFEVKRFGASGDKGRDVVGFCTTSRHDGEWDNYQCKQYRTKLGKSQGLLAVGKVLYWASQGNFTLPRKFYFVAPKGLNGPLLELVNSPATFRQMLFDDWAINCATKIITGKTIAIDHKLRKAIDDFDFSNIITLDVDEIISDSAAKSLLVELYGDDPGKYPKVAIPFEVQLEEMNYITALLEAYNERESGKFKSHAEVFDDPTHGSDLQSHRERYFEADGFQKFYRDNTSPETITSFRRDIHWGVRDKLKEPAKDQLTRICIAMAQASVVTPAGPLARYAYVPVKQGICHHLVNDGEMNWKGGK